MFLFLSLNYRLISFNSCSYCIYFVAAELAIPTGIPTIEGKAEIETHPVTVEAKSIQCLVHFKILQTFFCFYLLIHFALIL